MIVSKRDSPSCLLGMSKSSIYKNSNYPHSLKNRKRKGDTEITEDI